ncbi:MAG: hypothetical protein ACK4FE_13445 [Azonexus sp.]
MQGLATLFGQPDMAAPTVRYLQARQSPGGGFCFYRSAYLDEPNISDTYHAVRALHLLGAPPENSGQIAGFAKGFLESRHLLARSYAAWLLKCLAPSPPPGAQWLAEIARWPIPAPPGRSSPQLSAWLEQVRVAVRLKNAFAAGHDCSHVGPSLRALEHSAGGFGICPNLWDTWLALDILRGCEPGGSDLPATRGFVERLQVPVTGFALTEGSRSGNLDALFAGLRCCRILGIPVRFSSAIRSLLGACQTGRGGFARAPGASPNIEYTYKAVWAFFCLVQYEQGIIHAEP